jgi:hypothetical protein
MKWVDQNTGGDGIGGELRACSCTIILIKLAANAFLMEILGAFSASFWANLLKALPLFDHIREVFAT